MRESPNIAAPGPGSLFLFTVIFLFGLFFHAAEAGRIEKSLSPKEGATVVQTGIGPIAYASDSVFCDGRILRRGSDYSLNNLTGKLSFLSPIECDSLVIVCVQLPRWLTESVGHRAPEGKRLIRLGSEPPTAFPRPPSDRRITLSGNKSFSFSVGRTGESSFSQGLNVDFEVLPAHDLRVRGSISDRIGSGDEFVSGVGGTTVLSELDTYFFEIEGSRVLARGGDIRTAEHDLLPSKRITGVLAAYRSERLDVGADLGRPSGRFVSRRFRGVDGRQGPYQVVGSNGLPTGIVPGSEKVYLDGGLLEGGTDKQYEIDYPSGRITFSPRVLITSRSRIEIDFEAAAGDYRQVIYDVVSDVRLFRHRLLFSAGGRRESDEKDRLRFGGLSPANLDILRAAGDSSERATTSGAVPDTSGDYVLAFDTSGAEFYQYVGGGRGDYSVSFSYMGGGRGDYRYVGNGEYQFAGAGNGDYLPVRFLPLPIRNDLFFSTLEAHPYRGGVWRLDYRGNIRDNNLLSGRDDGDNFRSQLEGRISNTTGQFESRAFIRYRQEEFDPAYRLTRPDFGREYGLPPEGQTGDEFRVEGAHSWKTDNNGVSVKTGYLSYKDRLRSFRMAFDMNLFGNATVSPRGFYRLGKAETIPFLAGDGLFEKYGAGIIVRAIRRVRWEIGFERELVKDRFSDITEVEEYVQFTTALLARNSILRFTHRDEYQSQRLGYAGPRQYKIELSSEERIGRLQILVAATWFEQDELDSDRGSRTERLYRTTFRYAPSSAWVTLQADYRQNSQAASAFGYRYIKVDDGEGDYRFEDGRYIADPEGDYIRIREEVGGSSPVSSGEKSHNVVLYPGRWPALEKYRPVLSQAAFRLRTEVYEELRDTRERELSWILPWTSRSGLDYVTRRRNETYSLLLFPQFNFYVLNFSYGNSLEEQESGNLLMRAGREYKIEIKSLISATVRSRIGWRQNRDRESGAGIVPIRAVTDTYTAGLSIAPSGFQISPAVQYLRLSEGLFGGKGRGFIVSNEIIWRRPNRGEARVNIELRSLEEQTDFRQPEYLITDGRRFGKSALIGAVVNYDIGDSWRLTVNISDRLHEDHPADFIGRGELIARF